MRHEIIITKFKKVICFEQNSWLVTNTSFHTRKRAATKNKMQQVFHKLLNNTFSGKQFKRLKIE